MIYYIDSPNRHNFFLDVVITADDITFRTFSALPLEDNDQLMSSEVLDSAASLIQPGKTSINDVAVPYVTEWDFKSKLRAEFPVNDIEVDFPDVKLVGIEEVLRERRMFPLNISDYVVVNIHNGTGAINEFIVSRAVIHTFPSIAIFPRKDNALNFDDVDIVIAPSVYGFHCNKPTKQIDQAHPYYQRMVDSIKEGYFNGAANNT